MPNEIKEIKLPWGPSISPINGGKKTVRLTVTCSEEFRDLVNFVVRITGKSVSELGHRYFLEGLQRDIGTVFMAEPQLDRRLSEILGRK